MFFETVTDYIDKGYLADTLKLDFQKAFNKVPHCRLIAKLKVLGIDGKIASWIESWLYGRKQRVITNGLVSGWLLVKSGVPQGSVLGPLLFLIFINDLDDGISGIILKFADDTKLMGKMGKVDEIEKLTGDFKKLGSWSKEWQMIFNADKCKVLHFGHYVMNGYILESVEEERGLGVIIQSNLKVDK